MKIGVKNFRVFKEMTEFEIRPITVLVGPNNSGKSSFTKLLLLLKNGYDPLNFDEGEHHLEGYEKSLNWNLKNKQIIVKITKTFTMLPGLYTEEIIYNEKGEIDELKITKIETPKTKNKVILSFVAEQKTQTIKLDDGEEDSVEYEQLKFKYNIEFFTDLFYKKEIKVKAFDGKGGTFPILLNQINERSKADKESWQFYLDNVVLENYREYFQKHKKTNEKKQAIDIITNSVLINEINKLEEDHLLFDLFFDGKKVSDISGYKKDLLEYQNEVLSTGTGSRYGIKFFVEEGESPETTFRDGPRELHKSIEQRVQNKYKDYLEGVDKVEVKFNTLGRLIFKEKLFSTRGKDSKSFFPPIELDISFFEYFANEILLEISELSNTVYIPANRGHRERLFFGSDENKLFDDALKLAKSNESLSEESNKMFSEILEILGIKGHIIPKYIENTAVAIYIKHEKREINLADFGFGYSQLIPILIKLYNLRHNWNTENIIIIEEPEANLHPALQSKLADILKVITRHHPKWKLIVETHSEYLIRKLQFLTAKKELSPDDCIIHYFNADENVSREEPKVKAIEINENGDLTENFGPGFFDEATRLQFELLKLTRGQKN